ncbi:MAG: uracil-DNA glycosylase family protein [Proteobacteria bacterium]|nr:uracil-DNA glycosylase family protein [Pseudomonadota bacterium]
MTDSFDDLLARIHACRVCAAHLPHGPRPVLQAHPHARLLIVSQAPGRKVHESGIPFDDKSGEKLRGWLGIDEPTFHDERRVAIVPMAFCYPGKGASGDLPPRRECAPLWHPQLLPRLENIELTLAIGGYAIRAFLPERRGDSLTQMVTDWRVHLRSGIFPMPHPSPRNTAWFVYNPWFEQNAIPALRARVRAILRDR